MYNAEGAQFGLFGIDSGVITVDRGEDLLGWDDFGEKPAWSIDRPHLWIALAKPIT